MQVDEQLSSPVLPRGGRDLPLVTNAELAADAHGTFRLHRARTPVVAHETGSFFVLRHADIERLAKDPRAQGSGTTLPRILGVTEGPLFESFDKGMLTAHGEAHRRRRSPFSRILAARVVAELRPVIRRSAETLVDGWHRDGRVEFLEGFAERLPATIICGLLGVAPGEIPAMTKLVYDITRFVNLACPPGEIPQAAAAAAQLKAHIEGMIADRRREPQGDFLSSLVAAADAEGELEPLELVHSILHLIVGGVDTTRVAAAMLLTLLLQHRDQWEEVRETPTLIPGAVNEALRFEPSVASVTRLAAEPIEIEETVIPPGSFIVLSSMSAMRDERIYEEPDVFEIARKDHPRLHPVFGGGVHRCIGEALARLELEETLAVMTERLPEVQLEVAPVIRGHAGVRRVDRMVLSWRV